MEPISCELLSIGSELLVGETVDTNAAYLAVSWRSWACWRAAVGSCRMTGR